MRVENSCFCVRLMSLFFSGDLLTAKGLLAQMKYFTNIEEKVKDRITEVC